MSIPNKGWSTETKILLLKFSTHSTKMITVVSYFEVMQVTISEFNLYIVVQDYNINYNY